MCENFLSRYHRSIHRRGIWRILADGLVLQEMFPSNCDVCGRLSPSGYNMTEEHHTRYSSTERDRITMGARIRCLLQGCDWLSIAVYLTINAFEWQTNTTPVSITKKMMENLERSLFFEECALYPVLLQIEAVASNRSFNVSRSYASWRRMTLMTTVSANPRKPPVKWIISSTETFVPPSSSCSNR